MDASNHRHSSLDHPFERQSTSAGCFPEPLVAAAAESAFTGREMLLIDGTVQDQCSSFSLSGCLHRDCGLIPSRIERLHILVLQFDLKNLTEVPDGFVCVADLEIPTAHLCDLPFREKVFFCLCSLFLNEDSSLKSPLMIFFKALAILQSRTSLFDFFRSATDLADSASLNHTNASIGRLAYEDTSLLKCTHQILMFF